MDNTTHFCILVIGNLGECGMIALQNLSRFQNLKLCAMADSPGFEYLESCLSQLKSEISLCRHKIPHKHDWVLEGISANENYASFGEEKFFRLMYLKWCILEEALLEDHPSESLVFTDLDVIWRKAPSSIFSSVGNNEKVMALQKDFGKAGKKFFCPGIMFWKRSKLGLQILETVRDYHQTLMENERNLPDDKAINRWLLSDDNMKYLIELDEKEYIIGHRLISLILGNNGFDLDKYVAFHANYVSGLPMKVKSMQIAMIDKKSVLLRYKALARLILTRFKTNYS